MLEGYKYLKNIFSKSDISAIRNFLIDSYKNEHSYFIEQGSFSEYYSHSNPYPTGDVLDQVLKKISDVGVLDVPTVFGSLSLQTRLSELIINIFVGNSKIISELHEVFGFSEEYFMT